VGEGDGERHVRKVYADFAATSFWQRKANAAHPKPHQNSGHRASRMERLPPPPASMPPPPTPPPPPAHVHSPPGELPQPKGCACTFPRQLDDAIEGIRLLRRWGGNRGRGLRELTKDFDFRLDATCAKTSTKNMLTANRQMKDECVTTQTGIWIRGLRINK